MKLGKDTASVFNWIHSANPAGPVVGKGATILHWTDRSAYFVDSVSPDGKTCVIERAKAVPEFEGMTDSQSYRYERAEGGRQKTLKFRYGSWFEVGTVEGKKVYEKVRISFGVMDEYYDFSF